MNLATKHGTQRGRISPHFKVVMYRVTTLTDTQTPQVTDLTSVGQPSRKGGAAEGPYGCQALH